MPIILSLKTFTSIKMFQNINNTENYSTASSGAFCTRENALNLVNAHGLRSASQEQMFNTNKRLSPNAV